MRRELPLRRGKGAGFTLLEVMVAMAIIAIALTAVLGSQSQGVSLASEAKFSTTAALLAQDRLAQLELDKPDDLVNDSGDFGEDFPGYLWQVIVRDIGFEVEEAASDYLKKIELEISLGADKRYRYRLALYRFFPKSK